LRIQVDYDLIKRLVLIMGRNKTHANSIQRTHEKLAVHGYDVKVNLNKFYRTTIIACFCYFLVACASTQPQNEKAKTTSVQADQTSGLQQTLPSDQLASIEHAFIQSRDLQQRNDSLLQLADQYLYPISQTKPESLNESALDRSQNTDDAIDNTSALATSNCNAANQIVKHIQSSLQTQTHISHANIIKAECQLIMIEKLGNLVKKEPLLSLTQTWLSQAPVEPPAQNTLSSSNQSSLYWRKNKAQANLFAKQANYNAALETMLSLIKQEQPNLSSAFISQQYRDQIWAWFSLLENAYKRRLLQQFPALNAYKIMLDTIEDSSLNDLARQSSIVQWINNNPSNPIAQNLPSQVKSYLELNVSEADLASQKIAVLLPLSGRLSGQGQAIKQGVLASYYNNLLAAQTSSIEFIDTGSLPSLNKSINDETLKDYSVIVGPLLRSHIEQINTLDLRDKKHLLLNQLSQSANNQAKIYASFALAPEHEARQLVALMKQQNIQNPIVVSDGANITERMANAFVDAWQSANKILSSQTQNQSAANTTNTLQRIKYTDNQSMRIGITSALDVLQSQRRISQLSNLSEARVFSVTRNRRDVDAFVVFSRPDDLELINPIIESSISLFSDEQVPVFATSYSYNHKRSKNSLRDLKNVVFTDMPWLLPEQRRSSFANKIDDLFNQPPSAYLRLFAFGYDALEIVDNLAQLHTFGQLKIVGKSGVLSINDKQVERELRSIAITESDINAQ
jgi:outer membrane PBP1 activator LpoA protein